MLNIVGAVTPAVVTLLVTPRYLALIGIERFGVLSLLWLVLGYISLVDMGVGKGVARLLSKKYKSEWQDKDVFLTAIIVSLGLSLIGILGLFLAGKVFFWRVIGPGFLRDELFAVRAWMFIAPFVVVYAALFSGVIQAKEEFLKLNVINIIAGCLFQIMPLFAANFIGVELMVLLPAALMAKLAHVGLLGFISFRLVGAVSVQSFSSLIARHLFGFGGWLSVSSLVSPLMIMMDRMVIGKILGVGVLALYSIPYQLAERSTVLLGSYSAAIFPKISGLDEKDGLVFCEKNSKKLMYVLCILFFIGMVFLRTFFSLWVDDSFSDAATAVGIVLLLGFWFNGLAYLPYTALVAAGRTRLIACIHCSEIIPFGMVLIALVYYGGVNGAALAFSLRAFLDWILLSRCCKSWGFNKNNFIPTVIVILAALLGGWGKINIFGLFNSGG